MTLGLRYSGLDLGSCLTLLRFGDRE